MTLKVIPHNHFRVMLKDDQFLKAGLEATGVLQKKAEEAHGEHAAGGADRGGGTFSFDDDEILAKARRR